MAKLACYIRPGFLLPLLLLGMGVLDLTMRILPLEHFTIRGWEAVTNNDMKGGPFLPNQRYHNDHSYGDLAAMGNVRRLREYRSEDFSTDSWGFRNPPQLAERSQAAPAPQALVAGDSFAAGCGVSDEQTLAAQLSARTGKIIYCAAGGVAARLPDLRRLAGLLGMKRGTVIFAIMEREDPLPESAWEASILQTPPPPSPFTEVLWARLHVSRLAMLASQATRAVRRESHGQGVLFKRLRNDDLMGFFRGDVEDFYRPRRPRPEYWVWLREELRKDHLDLLMVLLPNKFTVYQPYFRIPMRTPSRPLYLDTLEASLREHSVPVVNLTHVFRARAASELEGHQYIYWRDDTHWNARGIALAAEEVDRAWSALAGDSAKP